MKAKSKLENRKFGRLTAIKIVGQSKWGHYIWFCECDCGNSVEVISRSLNSGETKSCGCLRKETARHSIKKLHLVQKGKGNPFYGKHHTPETKDKIRNSNYHTNEFGENNPAWNPNLTDEERRTKRNYTEYRKWRTLVYEKDNYTCQVCHRKGGTLNAHHLESYASNPDFRTTIENGVTLCEDCHRDFHHQYGKGDNTKEQFLEYVKL